MTGTNLPDWIKVVESPDMQRAQTATAEAASTVPITERFPLPDDSENETLNIHTIMSESLADTPNPASNPASRTDDPWQLRIPTANNSIYKWMWDTMETAARTGVIYSLAATPPLGSSLRDDMTSVARIFLTTPESERTRDTLFTGLRTLPANLVFSTYLTAWTHAYMSGFFNGPLRSLFQFPSPAQDGRTNNFSGSSRTRTDRMGSDLPGYLLSPVDPASLIWMRRFIYWLSEELQHHSSYTMQRIRQTTVPSLSREAQRFINDLQALRG